MGGGGGGMERERGASKVQSQLILQPTHNLLTTFAHGVFIQSDAITII